LNIANWKRCATVAMALGIVIFGMNTTAHSQTQPATGAVWVDPNGNVVGPALGNEAILLKIPSVGQLVLGIGITVFPSTIGDPIRWKYDFRFVPEFNIVMSFDSADCSGQGFLHTYFGTATGNTVVVLQFFDSVHHWLVVGSYPTIDPVPHFNSQIVQGLQGPGAYCQTVNVTQGGPVVPVTHVIDQQTLASPPMVLQ